MKKLFGGLNITWKKLIIFSILIGIYVGAIAVIPVFKDTSFRDISITFEWWVLFGTLIIVNSKSPIDSALKCFVFFLISQPLIYLVQVPWNPLGWDIFNYYPGWFRWTLLTIPMGFIGHYLKKDKWWGIFILVPVILFVGYHYMGFLGEARTYFPNHLLSAIFCAVTMIIYPLYVFKNKVPKYICLGVALLTIIGTTILTFNTAKNYYNTTILLSGGETSGVEFDDTYKVSFKDEAYGKVSISYLDSIESYVVNAEFTKTGDTELILEAPNGTKYEYKLKVGRSTYDIERITNVDKMVNPINEVEDLEAMNKLLGYDVVTIPNKGVKKYIVIGVHNDNKELVPTSGRIIYVDGSELDMTKGSEDISGIYGGKLKQTETINDKEVKIYTYEKVLYAIWTDSNYSYAYSIPNGKVKDIISDIKLIK